MSPDGTAGEPLIPLTRPLFGPEEAEAVARVLATGWVSQGPEVRAFEAAFARAVGAGHAVAVSSGTAALELALHALGIGRGDEVITVSSSFIATANAVWRVGAAPVFVDIEPETGNIDPDLIPAAASARTRAIIAVHQAGMPADMARILAAAACLGVPVIEDAACAAGSEIRIDGAWGPVGAPLGVVACFSLHPRKLITTGDGGIVTTDDPALAARLRRLRVHGMSLDADLRHRAGVVSEQYLEPGFNMRLTDLQAAVGLVQVGRLAGMVAARRRLAARFRPRAEALGLAMPVERDWARSNWQSLWVRLPDGADQHAVMTLLARRGVASRRGVMCAHREPAYALTPWRCAGRPGCGCPRSACARLRHSEAAQDRCVQLPLFPAMTEAEQDIVVDALGEALACAPT